MNDHNHLMILGGVVVVLAPFVLIGIGIASDYRTAHPRKPYQSHHVRNIVLGFAMITVASVVFAGLSHHPQAPTLAPAQANSATAGVPLVPIPTTVAAAHRDVTRRVCGNIAEVDHHEVTGAWFRLYDSVSECGRDRHDGHDLPDGSTGGRLGGCYHQTNNDDSSNDNKEHSRHHYDPRCHDNSDNAAAVNGDDQCHRHHYHDPRCHNYDDHRATDDYPCCDEDDHWCDEDDHSSA